MFGYFKLPQPDHNNIVLYSFILRLIYNTYCNISLQISDSQKCTCFCHTTLKMILSINALL